MNNFTYSILLISLFALLGCEKSSNLTTGEQGISILKKNQISEIERNEKFPTFTINKCQHTNRVSIKAVSSNIDQFNFLWWTENSPLGHGIKTICVCGKTVYVRVSHTESDDIRQFSFQPEPCRRK